MRVVGGKEAQVLRTQLSFNKSWKQENSYPWIAALLDKDGEQIDSFCSSVLVSFTLTLPLYMFCF